MIARTGEGGDGKHGYRLQIGIRLQHADDIQPRNMRKLNIHDDQVRPIAADMVDHFPAVAKPFRGMAVRLQQFTE